MEYILVGAATTVVGQTSDEIGPETRGQEEGFGTDYQGKGVLPLRTET